MRDGGNVRPDEHRDSSSEDFDDANMWKDSYTSDAEGSLAEGASLSSTHLECNCIKAVQFHIFVQEHERHLLVFADVEYYNGPFVAPHSTAGVTGRWNSGECPESSVLEVAGRDYMHADGKLCALLVLTRSMVRQIILSTWCAVQQQYCRAPVYRGITNLYTPLHATCIVLVHSNLQ